MTEFTKVMSTLSRRLSSGNTIPAESTRITREEFEIISDFIEECDIDLNNYYKLLDILQDLPFDVEDLMGDYD